MGKVAGSLRTVASGEGFPNNEGEWNLYDLEGTACFLGESAESAGETWDRCVTENERVRK
jgi:hypothetical protein